MGFVAGFTEFFDNVFVKVLIEEDRWRLYLSGIGNTLLMASIACVIGILLGLVLATAKVASMRPEFMFFRWLSNLYTTVIRGTPVLVQLLIIYYMIFVRAPLEAGVFVASLAFGLNSAAYVSEIIRAGIISVDKGQTEAGRSLGLNSKQTMRLIVLPQAVKNILPALFNEFISLLKETSVAGFISVMDITRAGNVVRSRVWTFSPLLVSAVIYLALVLGLTYLQQRLERRLATSDSR